MCKNSRGQDFVTALEIKSGKRYRSHRGQVLLYSLLMAERFKNSNDDNILLYIMDDNVKERFEIVKTKQMEINAIIICRNRLAKWFKLNQ